MGRALLLLAAFACSEEPQGSGDPPADSGTVVLCDEANPCPAGFICAAGVCETKEPADAGSSDAGETGARMQVCTPDGCEPPWVLRFGGSRIGVVTSQTIVVRSIGRAPLEIQNVEVRRIGSEFSCDPSGDLDLVLQPGEETAIRVTHTAADALEDEDALEIISNGQMVRTAVQLTTEYKGVPSLYVGTDPASNAMDVRVVDFGTVRAGSIETRTLYIKNKDRVIDGSILEVREARIDPASSTSFEVALDRTLPAFLTQFDALCNTDANCRQELGDTCETALGVCRTTDGPIRDVLTANVSFVGITPGVIEEDLLLLTNDGGGDTSVITRVVLRANVTESAITVRPDPIEFVEEFVGFTARRTVTVTNDGSAPLTLMNVALAETGTFSLDLSAISLPWTVAPATSSSFDVLYAPPAVGSHATQLAILSDDAALPMRTINVTGNAFTAPELELEPAPPIDFGDTHTQVGGIPSATVQVTARNIGGHELRISSIMTSPLTPPGFTVDPSALPPIPPGMEATFNVRYSPLAPSHPNVERGELVLVTNDPRVQPDARIPLSGRGVNPNVIALPGASINFNTLPTNPNAPEIFRGQVLSSGVSIVNGGFGPATVTSVAIVNDARGAFSISGVPPVPFTIDSGANVPITVGYTAPAAGVDGATIEVRTNDLDLPGGLLAISVIGSTSDCPFVPGADGTANSSGVCTYSCRTNYYDLDGDLNTAGTDGCEYMCVFQGPDDLPDDAYVDRNCDGIDGDVNQAVFVSPLGSDANPGSRDLPVRTIQYAVALAQSRGHDVYAGSGQYTEAQTINLPNGVSIYGGYHPIDFRSRSSGNITQIAVTVPLAIRANNVSMTTVLDHLDISSGDNGAAGGSSYGIFATSSNGLVVRRSTVRAGRGGAGMDGASIGGVAASGTPGANGEPGCEDSGGFCSGCGRPNGGGGGSSACGRTGGAGGRPGHGGSWGDPGGTGVGGTSGGAGAPNGQGNWNTPSAYWGANGANGSPGSDGAAGQPGFTVNGYAPSNGGNGGPGGDGNGGGGGGGGGGGDDDCDSYGGAGGGGGGGGCGGAGAFGGTSGGGSIAIYLWSSNATIDMVTLRTAGGGRGGNGGTGQAGGSGGAGGWGGDPARPGAGNPYGQNGEQDDGSNGGRGGNGGAGGRGGHGGGGAGGPSIGIYRGNGSQPNMIGTQFARGVVGNGGSSQGNSGPNGIGADVYP